MLALNNIEFGYPGFDLVVDLEIQQGTALALMGPSGCGKTTVLNLIAGFLNPRKGDIQVNGESIIALKPSLRPLTYLFQNNNLFPHLNVWQNLAIGLHPGMKVSDMQRQEIQQVLENVSLQGFEKRLPGNLSGGQQQRVALGRCLLRKRPLLLLDEPFSALDDVLRTEMIELVRRLQQSFDLTLLVSTHQRADAERLGAIIYKLD
jgi:thiamine transport system ATP-binding protein